MFVFANGLHNALNWAFMRFSGGDFFYIYIKRFCWRNGDELYAKLFRPLLLKLMRGDLNTQLALTRKPV